MVTRIGSGVVQAQAKRIESQQQGASKAAAPRSVAQRFGDEMSSGRGGALRARAAATLGAVSLATVDQSKKTNAVRYREIPEDALVTVLGPTIGTRPPAPLPPQEDWPMGVTVQVNGLNFREGPDATTTSQGKFSSGTELVMTGQSPEPPADAEWYQVSTTDANGERQVGWVSAQYVSDPHQAVAPEVTARMIELGYVEPGGTIDSEDIRNFQVMNSLPETGEFDAATLNRMGSPYARVSTFLTQFKDSEYNPKKKTGGGDNSCGPASVAMNLAALGLATIDNANPQTLIADVRGDTNTVAGDYTGTSQLVAAAEANGATTTSIEDMNDLDLALARGEPVVLYGVPNQTGSYYTGTAEFGAIEAGGHHWISVVGRTENGEYIIQDPLSRNGTLTVTREELETYAVWKNNDGTPSSFSMSAANE